MSDLQTKARTRGNTRRRTGGHAGRVARRLARGTRRNAITVTRRIPTYELLDEEALVQLESHAEWILREIGVEFRGDEEALRLFKDAGATVKGTRVRFDSGLAPSLCSTAPSTFRMEGRDSAASITILGDWTLAPGFLYNRGGRTSSTFRGADPANLGRFQGRADVRPGCKIRAADPPGFIYDANCFRERHCRSAS